MKTTTRRRNRLRSAQYPTERWKPPAALIVLTIGLLFGLALGLSNRLFHRSADVQQHYMLLVSDLYAQGVPLAAVRDRLVSLGYSNPSVAVLAIADQLARSHDKVSQQEADQLHQFAEALVAEPDSGAAVAGQPTASVASPTIAASTPVPAIAPAPTLTPTAAPTDVSTPTVVVEANPVPELPPSPTATAPAQPTPAPAKPGVIHTSGRQPAVLRSGPTTKSAAVAIVPDGAKVQVYGTVRGEALEPPEARWYHVAYNGRAGYLYVKLVQVGG